MAKDVNAKTLNDLFNKPYEEGQRVKTQHGEATIDMVLGANEFRVKFDNGNFLRLQARDITPVGEDED